MASVLGRVFLALILAGFLGLIILVGVLMSQPMREQLSWMEVPCVVEQSRVVMAERSSTSRGRTTYTNVYTIAATYRYRVAGEDYVGRRYSTVNDWNWRWRAEGALKDIPAGSVTSCWVDPSHPSTSVLRREVDWMLIVTVPLLSLLPLGGLWILCGAPAFWRRPASWLSRRRAVRTVLDAISRLRRRVRVEPTNLPRSTARRRRRRRP